MSLKRSYDTAFNNIHTIPALTSLSQDTIIIVFSYLNAESLAVVNLVSYYWNRLTKTADLLYQLNLKTLFKRVSFIDKSIWQARVDLDKYGLSFEGCFVGHQAAQNGTILPPIGATRDVEIERRRQKIKMIKVLQRCLAWPIEKIGRIKPGVTVVDIPNGLSINKLLKLDPNLFDFLHPEFLQKYGHIEEDQAHTTIITDHVMDQTRRKDAQQQLIEIKKHGGERPKAREFITLHVFTCLNSEKKLNGIVQNPEISTRCEESIAGEQTVIGATNSKISILIYSHGADKCGLAACKRF